MTPLERSALFLAISILLRTAPMHSSEFYVIDTQYQYQTITCAVGESCSITCASEHVCLDSTIICPSDAECSIGCEALYSCDGFTVYCPSDAMCSISCSGERSCRNMILHPPSSASNLVLSHDGTAALSGVNYPIYAQDDYTDYSLLCNTRGLCQGMNIMCPKYARCMITCSAHSACMDANISWPQIAGFGTIICVPSQNYACRHVLFAEPDPYIIYSVLCDGISACYESSIICPTNESCDITCSQQYACAKASIKCPLSGNCSVTCTSENACKNVNISWSSLAHSYGFLHCDTSSSDVCIDVNEPPTFYPTANPTMHTLAPSTSHPTMPTLNPSAKPSTANTQIVSKNAADSNGSKGWNAFMDSLCATAWVLYVAIAVIVVLIFGLCALLFLLCLPSKSGADSTDAFSSTEVVEIQHNNSNINMAKMNAMQYNMKAAQYNMNMFEQQQQQQQQQQYGAVVPVYAIPHDINNDDIHPQLPDTYTQPQRGDTYTPGNSTKDLGFNPAQYTFTSTGDSLYNTPRGEERDQDPIWNRLRKSTSIYLSEKKKAKHSVYRLEGIKQEREMRQSEFETDRGGKIFAIDQNQEAPFQQVARVNKYNQHVVNDANIVAMAPKKKKRKKKKESYYDERKYGKCMQMGCYCAKYIASKSKWSRNQCQKCNHKPKQHEAL